MERTIHKHTKRRPLTQLLCTLCFGICSVFTPRPIAVCSEPVSKDPDNLEFIATNFENASPLWYERDAQGTIHIHLHYDHERSSPNRAAGHFHFQVQAKPG